MKHLAWISTLILLLVTPQPVNALVSNALNWYECDFRNLTAANPMDGWTCYGSQKTPADVEIGSTGIPLSTYFNAGSPAYVPIDFIGLSTAMCSNSSTLEGGAVAEWLISPEIDLTDAPADLLLSFTAVTVGSETDAKFEVYVSDAGNKPEDFSGTPIYSGKQKNSLTSAAASTIHRTLKDCGGKKIHIAFLNRSRNAQILGFTDISLNTYELAVMNRTPSFTDTPGEFTVDCQITMMTPVPCEGFKAVLAREGEEDQIYTTSKQLGVAPVETVIRFPQPLAVGADEKIDYTVTVSPAYDGAPSCNFDYSISCSEGFPAVCVAEEGTGSWCQWCTRGIAALNMYSDLYPGRYFGIAVHSSDPMALSDYFPMLGIPALPGALYNRRYNGDVFATEAIESILAEKAGEKVEILSCQYNPDTNIMDLTYAPTLAYATSSAHLTAAAVVTADGMKGTGREWMQSNAYSGWDQTAIEMEYGDGAWPYFKNICTSASTIYNIAFDHVALGIFNSYYGGGSGAELPSEWLPLEPQTFTLSFEMPLYAREGQAAPNDWKNTAVTLLLLATETGHILTADRMKADKYDIETDGVERNAADGAAIKMKGHCIDIVSSPDTKINIYSAGGQLLHSSQTGVEMHTSIDAARWSGITVVQVTNQNHTTVKKLLLPD